MTIADEELETADGMRGNAAIRVVADHREAESAAVAGLRKMEGVALRFGHLEAGDYLVEGLMLFERKTLMDLAESVKDGRLFRQARALASLAEPLRGALILEGSSADLARSGMRREALQGALITVTLFFGIPGLRALDGMESARLMLYAARQARAYASGALPRRGIRPKGKRKTQLAILQSLPGVGPGRAEELLGTFGSVEAVLAANTEALAAVPGIGKRTARAIRWAVGEEPAVYQRRRKKKKGAG
jgi:ERCC4-type nuclease